MLKSSQSIFLTDIRVLLRVGDFFFFEIEMKINNKTNKTKPHHTKPSHTKPNYTKPHHTKTNPIKLHHTTPDQTKPDQANNKNPNPK